MYFSILGRSKWSATVSDDDDAPEIRGDGPASRKANEYLLTRRRYEGNGLEEDLAADLE